MKTIALLLLLTVNALAADLTAAKSGNWSTKTTWGGTLPGADDNITIPAGIAVTLNVSPPPLGSVTVMGSLNVSRKATTLTARWIMAHMGGVFSAGTEASPFAQKLVITLTGTNPAEVGGMGTRFIGSMHGGRIELIGRAPAKSWLMLVKDAAPGDTSMTLSAAPTGWRVGDRIIITTSSTDWAQTEERTITAIATRVLTLDAPLAYPHRGTVATVKHTKAGVPTTIDTRAEVALLTRPIVVQGPEESEATQFGAHGMIMGEATGKFQGVEFYRGGQSGFLGRYPIHWHNVGEAGANSFIRKCSVHRSYNRAVTIHKTNRMTIAENVAYDIRGYGFFLEDGKEVRNVFTRNLAALVQDGALDERDGGGTPYPSGFWISNPDNDFIDNAVAGVDGNGNGYWYDVKEHPRANSISTDPNYFCELQPMGVFRGNRVHGIRNVTDLGRGGWGVGIEFDNGRTDNLIQDFTVFDVQGVAHYNAEMAKIGGRMTFLRSRVLGDFVAFKGNSTFQDSLFVTPGHLAGQPIGGSIVTMGYDGTPALFNTVFAGYGNAIAEPGHNPISIASPFEDCTPLGSYVTDGRALPRDRFCLLISDPSDAWGNGAPGCFVNQPYLSEATGNAKGINPADPETRWSPESYGGLEIKGDNLDQVLIGDYPLIRSHGSAPLGILSMKRTYRLTIVGDGVRITYIDPLRESANAAPGDAMRIVFRATGNLTGMAFDWRNNWLQPPCASLAEWQAAPGNNWYLDPSGDVYVSMRGARFPYGVRFYYDGANP